MRNSVLKSACEKECHMACRSDRPSVVVSSILARCASSRNLIFSMASEIEEQALPLGQWTLSCFEKMSQSRSSVQECAVVLSIRKHEGVPPLRSSSAYSFRQASRSGRARSKGTHAEAASTRRKENWGNRAHRSRTRSGPYWKETLRKTTAPSLKNSHAPRKIARLYPNPSSASLAGGLAIRKSIF